MATALTDPHDDNRDADHTAPRPIIELTPEVAERLRDPRLVLAVVAMAAGAIALLLGWYGVSGTFDPGVQLSYVVSGGLGGLFLAGVGAALVSSSNMRQATRKIDDLQQSVDALSGSLAEALSELQRLSAAGSPAPAAKRAARPRAARRTSTAADA